MQTDYTAVSDTKKINGLIARWESINRDLEKWLSKHDFDDPDYEEKLRESNNAKWKLQQLSERITRPVKQIGSVYIVPFKLSRNFKF